VKGQDTFLLGICMVKGHSTVSKGSNFASQPHIQVIFAGFRHQQTSIDWLYFHGRLRHHAALMLEVYRYMLKQCGQTRLRS